MSQHEQFVDAEVAAGFLGVSRGFVLKLARDGKIPAHALTNGTKCIRRMWRFRISELEDHMENATIKPIY
jgi:excisionase family DNA binding protein